MRFAAGIFACQVLWAARLWLPQAWWLPAFLVIGLLEAVVPVWANKAGSTPWHAHHITERYGLFTIIVLGECVLGAATALTASIDSRGWSLEVALVGFGAMSLIFSLWWVYFLVPSAQALHAHRDRVLSWAYWHVLAFGALAALGAFLGVVADQFKRLKIDGDAHKPGEPLLSDAAHATLAVSPTVAITLVVGAVIVYLLTIAWINRRVTQHQGRLAWMLVPCIVLLIAAVVAVTQGMSLALAIALLPLGPISLILLIERELAVRPGTFRMA